MRKIKMRLGEEPSQEEKMKESFLKEQMKEKSLNYTMGKVFDEIKITQAKGIANIAMPEPTLQVILGFLSELQELLQKRNKKEMER